MSKTITPKELDAKIQSGQVIDFIDVRTPEEYYAGHAQGARLLPLDRLQVDEFKKVRRSEENEPIYFICKSGKRSQIAADKFEACGLPAISVAGGTEAWLAANLTIDQ